ncbi:beta-fructofuranosidase [Pseudobutyrivibrio sp. YE44]|uniref:glycoside hydrolase family 32 protein n=1 Tax=Pseudobutyrivibrio sp. YE44 TaxID=1520802 RepID=UPI0008804674|nr:GH32 C-terminal domain-containing protein [Pseudobutyrivibrio sp. YE44]SDB23343.1 beta-fructofuranosidase [Pseudobutyrivibrio sp. YE44]
MITEKLAMARQYEKESTEQGKVTDRPAFHATGTVGWINDPNGFSIYKGEYHLFYQYYPYDNHWGPMHWGHSKTSDFIKWDLLPCAIAPDSDEDAEGCFSGSAIETPDGKHLLVYTGITKAGVVNGQEKCYQQQCVAIGDGVDYEKVDCNPVIPKELIPEGNNKYEFRDPKILYRDGKYYTIAVNMDGEDCGNVLVFESEDMLHWDFLKQLDESKWEVGRVWECPDYFALGDSQVLIVSPQETEGDGYEILPGFNNFFLVGKETAPFEFNRNKIQPIDFGTDFYAAQTLESKDGRRIMIAWMQNWETKDYGNDNHGFFGMMTLPRELWDVGGYVYQQPVKELETYYNNQIAYSDVRISEEMSLDGVYGRVLDMKIDLKPEQGNEDYIFKICVAKDEKHQTFIELDARKGICKLDRSGSGYKISALSTREFPVDFENGKIDLRVVLDRWSMELFFNGGKYAASMKIDTEVSADAITFQSDKLVKMNLRKYDFVDIL